VYKDLENAHFVASVVRIILSKETEMAGICSKQHSQNVLSSVGKAYKKY
jgi:hypothetical protein